MKLGAWRRRKEELEAEMASHIEMAVRDRMARGESEKDARNAALREFGNVTHIAEVTRDVWKWAPVERLDRALHELRASIRRLRNAPVFAATVVGSLALGLGATATMFSVVDGLFFRLPPGVADPGHLSRVEVAWLYGGETMSTTSLSYPFFHALREDTATFAAVAAAGVTGRYTLDPGPDATQLRGRVVSGNFFKVLGTIPARGRLQLGDYEQAVVISHDFWQRHFAGAADAIGRVMRIGPGSFTVVGIAPAGFHGVRPEGVDVWVPIGSAEGLRFGGPTWATEWRNYALESVVRVRPAVTPAAAAARALAILDAGDPVPSRNFEHRRVTLGSTLPADQLDGFYQARLAWLLSGISLLVLVIACANVTNLLIARALTRRRELAVRVALGASRGRIVGLLLSEAAILTLFAGATALVVASWGSRVLRARLIEDFVWSSDPVNRRVVGVTAVLVLGCILGAGLWPALGAGRRDLTVELKAGGQKAGLRSRVRNALLALQGALAVLLLMVGGLFVRSIGRASAVNLGFDSEHVLAATMDLSSLAYQKADVDLLYGKMADEISRIPGVTSTAITSTHPLGEWSFGVSLRPPGRDSVSPRLDVSPYDIPIGPGYFETIGTRIIRGRAMTRQETLVNAPVAVVSEGLAHVYWPGKDAIGECIHVGSDARCVMVVGIAEETRQTLQLDARRPVIYVPLHAFDVAPRSLLVRTTGAPTDVVAAVRKAMQSAAPGLPYAEVHTFSDLMAPRLHTWNVGAALSSIFGVLATLIAALGLYSVVAFVVAQRRFEIGVRVAVGAQRSDVVRLVVRGGITSLAAGVGVGMLVALASGRLIAFLLFDTSPSDPAVVVGVVAILAAVGAIAALLPARQATRVDMLQVLTRD